jgi:MFS family permease
MSLPAESAPALPSAAARRWQLAAAISSVTVFGVGISLSAPLLSLVLEARGTDATLTGINAASTFIGVMVGPLLAPRAVGRIGIRRFLLSCFALDIALFLLLKLTDDIGAWFVLRLALGIVGSSIFTATEAWINLLADNAGRGRILGLYIASLSAGFGTGPLLLSVTGIAGWTPFVAGSLVVVLAALPLLAAGDGTRDLGRSTQGPFTVFLRQPILVLIVALFGLYEAASMSLLPIWGVRIGLGDRLAAATVSAVYFGAIALQVPVGWLSDKIERRAALRLCAAAGLVGAALLPLAAGVLPALFAVLFLWGGFATAIYPIALAMAGERFRGAELVTVNAAIVIAYGVGALVGPVLGGAALDTWDAQGLPVLLTLIFALLAATTVSRRA